MCLQVKCNLRGHIYKEWGGAVYLSSVGGGGDLHSAERWERESLITLLLPTHWLADTGVQQVAPGVICTLWRLYCSSHDIFVHPCNLLSPNRLSYALSYSQTDRFGCLPLLYSNRTADPSSPWSSGTHSTLLLTLTLSHVMSSPMPQCACF